MNKPNKSPDSNTVQGITGNIVSKKIEEILSSIDLEKKNVLIIVSGVTVQLVFVAAMCYGIYKGISG